MGTRTHKFNRQVQLVWTSIFPGYHPTSYLSLKRVDVVKVDVGIAQGVHKFTRLEAAHVGHHDGQQGIAGNVEGYPQTLTVQLPLQGSATHTK